MVLARILAQEHFGVMALVLAVTQLFDAFTEMGIRQAVIQNPRGGSDGFLNVAWWLSSVRGIGLFLLGALAAPWIANLYGEPRITAPLQVTLISLLLGGLTNPALYVLERNLQFARYVLIRQGTGLFGTVVSLLSALICPNVWALVVGVLSESAARCAASIIFCPFFVSLSIDRRCLGAALRFSRGFIGLPILVFLASQIDVFVIGKLGTKAELGAYYLAVTLAGFPYAVFTQIGPSLLLPVFSRFQGELVNLRSLLIYVTRGLLVFGAPLFLVLALLAESLLALVYGPSYARMGVACRMLVANFFLLVIASVFVCVYLSLGRSELHRAFAATRAFIVCALMYPAVAFFGASGAAAALLCGTVAATLVQLVRLRSLICLDPSTLFRAASAAAIPTAVAGAIVLGAAPLLPDKPAIRLSVGTTASIAAWGLGLVLQMINRRSHNAGPSGNPPPL